MVFIKYPSRGVRSGRVLFGYNVDAGTVVVAGYNVDAAINHAFCIYRGARARLTRLGVRWQRYSPSRLCGGASGGVWRTADDEV